MSSMRFLIAASLMVAVGGYVRFGASSDLTIAPASLASLPERFGEWHTVLDTRLDRQTEETLRADSYVLRTYARAAAPVTLFVAYYGSQRTGHTIHSPLNCLPGTGWEWALRDRERLATESGSHIEVNRNIAIRNRQQILVYYWYQSRGRVEPSDYWNKAFLVRDALTLQRSDGALVRVTVPLESSSPDAATDASAFIRDLFPSLKDHLPG